MKFGLIGAGTVAQTLAKHFVSHGHEVVFSNSRGPESLKELARSFGPNASAGTVADAAAQDVAILCVRWDQAERALAQVPDWSGRILVDATNHVIGFDPVVYADTKDKTSSEVIAAHAPGAHVIKAFNTIVMDWIADVSDDKPRTVVFLSGDSVDAKAKLAGVLDEIGFAPVDLGDLAVGGKLQQAGGPLLGLNLDLLDRFEF